jgi:hypothetical protein
MNRHRLTEDLEKQFRGWLPAEETPVSSPRALGLGRWRVLRYILAIVPIGILLFFFTPLIPAVVFHCNIGFGGSFDPGGPTCLTNNSGLESLGNWLFHWGAVYAYDGGTYLSPAVSNLTTFGVMLFIALPLLAPSIVLLSPEIHRAFAHRSVPAN